MGYHLSQLGHQCREVQPDGGAVTVTLRQEQAVSQVVVIVADRGMGIPAAELPALFTPFHRGSNVADRIAGAGIGLLSVKQIIEQHGGSITVESEEGRGTTVNVWLPLA